MLSRFFASSSRLALASGVKKWPYRFNPSSPAVSVASLPHQPHLSYCSSSTIAALRCNNNSYGDCSGSFFRGKLAPIKLPFLHPVLSPSSAVVATASVSTAAASYGDSSSRNGGGGGDGQDGDANNSPSSSQSGSNSSSSGSTDDGPPQEQDGLPLSTTANLSLKRRRSQYRYKYRKAYTPGDLRQAAQNDEPVYFMLTPPEQPNPGVLNDCYVDTSTLQWLYNPPVSVLSTQVPEHMNLSTVFVLYHPSSQQQQQQQQQQADAGLDTPALRHLGQPGAVFHSFAHDYYMFTSYVMPAAQLSIASHAVDNYYDVTFKITPTPSAIYYDYNSHSQRYAFFEMRSGTNGPERIYLVPVLLPEADASGPNRRVIRGKLLEDGTPVPEEFYTFLAFSANIHIYITNLPTL